ncbi:MAG TPA: hypothetical protein ENN03_01200 [bacterium]|nr:hypothetical protein [bacterium]
MKTAVTADLHLQAGDEYPERYQALRTLLTCVYKEGIRHLIIAGDLFHKDIRNLSDFESVCREEPFRSIRITVVPGNHDCVLDNRRLASDNVTVVDQPVLIQEDLMGMPLLFVPYDSKKTMGEVIASFMEELKDGRWILIGHGDWIQGLGQVNPLEPGVYMPLTRRDLEQFQPAAAILGHIHKPTDSECVHYPGSPHPLDINETGPRRLLVLDTETAAVTSLSLPSSVVYFQESFIVFPEEQETEWLSREIKRRIHEWGVDSNTLKRVKVRVRVSGYTSDKKKLLETIFGQFRGIEFFDKEPDLTRVFQEDPDPDRREIIRRVMEKINTLEWPEENEPFRDEILLQAMHVIYGEPS